LIKDGGEQHKPEYRAVNPQELVRRSTSAGI